MNRYQAKWVLPVDSPPIENGVVEVTGDRITSIRKSSGAQTTVDLGEVAIIPGLVNAHTHLEFSSLDKPLGHQEIEFTDWVKLVIENRLRTDSLQKSMAIKSGIEESIRSGVVAIGEIATLPFDLRVYEAPVLIRIFIERLGQNPNNIDETMAGANAVLQDSSRPNNVSIGVSPHAPYSVHPDLLDQLCHLADQIACPIAMHLAETMQELELLESSSGSFVDLLTTLNAFNPTVFGTPQKIGDYISSFPDSINTLLIHGNYFTENDFDLIVQRRDQFTVVFCPRTHRYFGHSRYPIEHILKRNIRFAIGTDSAASSPNLDLFEELKTVAALYPEVSNDRILSAATMNGAKALGVDHLFGSLAPGKSSRFSIVESSDGGPFELGEIFSGNMICEPIAAKLAQR